VKADNLPRRLAPPPVWCRAGGGSTERRSRGTICRRQRSWAGRRRTGLRWSAELRRQACCRRCRCRGRSTRARADGPRGVKGKLTRKTNLHRGAYGSSTKKGARYLNGGRRGLTSVPTHVITRCQGQRTHTVLTSDRCNAHHHQDFVVCFPKAIGHIQRRLRPQERVQAAHRLAVHPQQTRRRP
jgi:hypothetical protein